MHHVQGIDYVLVAGGLTEWVEVKWYVDALFDALRRLLGGACRRRLDGESVQPYPNPLSVVSPQRVFQGTNSTKMYPAEFDAVSEYLHIIFDLLVSGLSQLAVSVCGRAEYKKRTFRGRRSTNCPPTIINTVATDRSSTGSPISTRNRVISNHTQPKQ